MRRIFSLQESKSNEAKVTEEYCWAMTQVGAGRSCCDRSGSSVMEFGFQLDSFLYTYTLRGLD
jgi:hypothetical protein